jgi:hypothetical protein
MTTHTTTKISGVPPIVTPISVQTGVSQGVTVASGLDAQTPLLLLPINIETRFIEVNEREYELWVRVYPDQVAINSHEAALTTQENTDGQNYWDSVWSAGHPPATTDLVQAPWRGLASLYGPQRAAWIALQLTPVNIAQQPVAATAAGLSPSPAPIYPTPPNRASSWEQPAVASGLPDFWTFVLVSGATSSSHTGTAIPAQVNVGITPGGGQFPPGSPVDAGLAWLNDFETASSIGMAIKIPLTADQWDKGFDQLFVYGLRTTGTGTEDLEDLIDAHHYTDGFALILQGSSTKNTSDAPSSFSRKDPNYDISFAVERQGSLNTISTNDGNVFANLMGINPSYLAHIQNADQSNALSGQDMLTALWPSTLGYFLSQIMDPVFPSSQIEDAREYVVGNAVPRGAVPPFRVGRTPYGVVPVTSLSRYKSSLPDSSEAVIEENLVQFVQRLWSTWLSSSSKSPHMQNSGDPDSELVGLLGMDASSINFRGRQVFGEDFLWNYMAFLGSLPAFMTLWEADEQAPGRELLNSYRYNSWDPRVIRLGFAQDSFPISQPTVQSGTLSETDQLTADAILTGGTKGNYIQWLQQASVADIQSENYPGTKPTALLYQILRQSLILDYAKLATTAEIGAGRLTVSQLREPELIGIPAQVPPAFPSYTTIELLSRPSIPDATRSWAEYLVDLVPAPSSPYDQLLALRASLTRLAALPTAELDRLLTETLDACSHRLDVWATTIANAILNRTRASSTRVHIGGFGWVENIRPAGQRAVVTGAELTQVQQLDALRAQRVPGAPTLALPVQPLIDNGGFIYAPSAEQAAAAAVLRSGYMTHKGTPDEALLGMDLSSDRVRNALFLLEGIQQGQSLNALLGYLFESGLVSLGLQVYQQPFRNKFPIVGNKLTPSSSPSESVAASNVVDGVALKAAWDSGQLAIGNAWGAGLPSSSGDQTPVITLLTTLDDYFDALSEVAMAETVFQSIRSNFGRAGGLMDAISKGDRPPDPDILDTPRGGLDLSHRVLLLFVGAPTVAAPWATVPTNPRAAAEPWLEAWITSILPDPSTVVCSVLYQDAAGNHEVNIRLLDLQIGALDSIYLADSAATPQQSELEARIIYAANLSSGVTKVSISYQPTSPPVGAILFHDFFFLVKNIRSLFNSARTLTPQDLTVPEKDASTLGGVIDISDLTARAQALINSLTTDIASLTTALANIAAGTVPVIEALFDCSFYGVPGSIPSTVNNAPLSTQATSVLATLSSRLTTARSIPLATATQDQLVSVFTTILGSSFSVLTLFTPPDTTSLNTAFGQSTSLVSSDPAAPSRWLTQLTHIRPAISRLDATFSLAQILSGGSMSQPIPILGQLPAVVNDKWLALPIDPANPPDKGRIAFASFGIGDPTTVAPFAGLLIDEWPERIPSINEDAYVAFHYEEPTARAPQACLLAVCPDDRATWDDDLLLGVLQDTLELTKIRTVDLSTVQNVGQILPALYFTLNLEGATVSTNFTGKLVHDIKK